jgi:hypothetical protein
VTDRAMRGVIVPVMGMSVIVIVAMMMVAHAPSRSTRPRRTRQSSIQIHHADIL